MIADAHPETLSPKIPLPFFLKGYLGDKEDRRGEILPAKKPH